MLCHFATFYHFFALSDEPTTPKLKWAAGIANATISKKIGNAMLHAVVRGLDF